METVTVFDAARDGYRSMRIPALVCTPGGTLLAFCEARREASDWAAIDLVMRRSRDGGRTWGPLAILAASDGRVAGNPTPIVDGSGVVHLLYQRAYARVYHLRTEDEGETWSEPRDLTPAFEAFRPEYPWKVVAPGPGHGIRLSSGRLLIPVWLCAPDPTIRGGDHRPSCVATMYSDDSGETWQRGEIVVNTSEKHPNPSESMAAELSDGRVMLNIRNESPRQRRLVSASPDGVSGWSRPTFDEALHEPVCMASLLRYRDSLVFCNPDPRPDPGSGDARRKHARENLTLRISRDDGTTWPRSMVVDPGPAGYSDLAAGPDGDLYCLYENGNDGPGIFPTASLAQFSP